MSTELVARTLEEHERVIDRGLGTFVEVGQSLAAIRDQRLYRADHPTFEAYCEHRWGFSDSRARQMIAAAETVTTVTVAGGPPPTSERQARELSGLDPNTAADVMRQAGPGPNGRPTAGTIRDARARVTETTQTKYDVDTLTGEVVLTPNEAVGDYIDSSQKVQDSRYVHRFLSALTKADDFLAFDRDRLALLLDDEEAAAVERFAAGAARFSDAIRRGRSGLRVINGANS